MNLALTRFGLDPISWTLSERRVASRDELSMRAPGQGVDVLALDEALRALAQIDRRKSRVVELRYFGGLTVEETAEFMGVSVDVVKRDWRVTPDTGVA